MSAGNNVVFEGPKFFWRAKCTIDVVIAEHDACNVVEVICSENTTNQLANRLYLNRLGVMDKLDPLELSDRLHMANEMALRRRRTFDESAARVLILREVLSEYVLDRLVVLEFTPQSLILTFQDTEDATELICNKPTNFTPARTPKEFHPLKPEEVKNALHRMKTEREALHKVCANAAKMERIVRRLSFRKERWRMPIVVLKVAHGRKLIETDAWLWETIARNDVEYFADDSHTGDSDNTGTNSAHKIAPVSVSPKGSRWVGKVEKPTAQRKNSFTVGIAALQSSLQRTLHSFSGGSGLLSSSSGTTQQETAQHMRAAVGGNFDGEQPHVVLTKPTVPSEVAAEPVSFAELVQNLLRKDHSAAAGTATTTPKAAVSTHKVTPLGRSHSAPAATTHIHDHQGHDVHHQHHDHHEHHAHHDNVHNAHHQHHEDHRGEHHMHAQQAPHGHAKAQRRHSHWTGERARNSPTTHSDATAQQLQARRILERLRRGGSACATSPAAGASKVDSVDCAGIVQHLQQSLEDALASCGNGLGDDADGSTGEDEAQLSALAPLPSKNKPISAAHF